MQTNAVAVTPAQMQQALDAQYGPGAFSAEDTAIVLGWYDALTQAQQAVLALGRVSTPAEFVATLPK